MSGDKRSTIQSAFERQARAFAHSPLHRDPDRLSRLLDFMAPRRGEVVLDVACGPGIVTAALGARGAQAYGVDLTGAMLREALQAGGGRYARGDALSLPFLDGAFDLAVCRNSLHHLADPAAAIREMTRVVRPGGRVVLEDRVAPDQPAQREYQERLERLRDVAHVRTLTRSEFYEMAERGGLAQPCERPLSFVIDFDEWIDRAYPTAADRDEARRMLEGCLEDDRRGLHVWREEGRIKFEAHSLLFGAERP